MTKDEINKILKPLNEVIQVCPNCGKIDVYRNDGHSCRDQFTRLLNEGYEL